MAWRIEEHVVRGEIDNRTRDETTVRIWFAGRDRPVVLTLSGNPWRDLAGQVLRFSNPAPKPGLPDDFPESQRGRVGDITASRKVKVPEVPIGELMSLCRAGMPYPFHWKNALYLEFFGELTGRVVIESADFTLTPDGVSAWTPSEAEEAAQHRVNAEAMSGFMDRLTVAAAEFSEEDDSPPNPEEARADKEADDMDRFLDRVTARMDREPDADFDTILDEELERRRRERGEPEVAPEEIAERLEALDEAASDMSEKSGYETEENGGRSRHPLVVRCSDLAVRWHRDIKPWLPPGASAEHPLAEIVTGMMIAGGKLAGALTDHEEWPPGALLAGDVLVRLKKARDRLRDTLAALDAADLENLATPEWRAFVRHETRAVLAEVERLIAEVRRVL